MSYDRFMSRLIKRKNNNLIDAEKLFKKIKPDKKRGVKRGKRQRIHKAIS